VAGLGIGSVGIAPRVDAAGTYKVVGTGGAGVKVRAAANTSSKHLKTLKEGTKHRIECQVEGQTVTAPNGVKSRIWNRTNGGYASDLFFNTPNVNRFSMSKCGATAPAPAPTTKANRALQWVESKLGATYGPEIGRNWSGMCEAFAEIAYGTRYKFGSATLNYNAQRAAGRVRTDGTPPQGALVFYGGGNGDGHIGISQGNGYVISTQGYNGQSLPVWKHSLRGLSNPYLGWATAPSDWPGR
jgi:hypothetical protein